MKNDTPYIDGRHNNDLTINKLVLIRHDPVSSITMTGVHDNPSLLTLSPYSSKNRGLLTPIIDQNKGTQINQNQTTTITPIDLLRKSHFF